MCARDLWLLELTQMHDHSRLASSSSQQQHSLNPPFESNEHTRDHRTRTHTHTHTSTARLCTLDGSMVMFWGLVYISWSFTLCVCNGMAIRMGHLIRGREIGPHRPQVDSGEDVPERLTHRPKRPHSLWGGGGAPPENKHTRTARSVTHM